MSKVKVYSTSTCPYCKLEKEYLSSKNIAFEEMVLDEHPEKVKAFYDTCGSMGVPCTHIVQNDGTEVKVLGFDKPKLAAAMGLGSQV